MFFDSKLFLTTVMAWLVVGCSAQKEPNAANLNSFVADPVAENMAVFLSNNGGSSSGVKNKAMLKKVLEASGFRFSFLGPLNNRDTSQFESSRLLSEAARKVGLKGTLLMYATGHGHQNNCPGIGAIQNLVNAVKNSRRKSFSPKDRPISRMILLIGGCYSGGQVQGSHAIHKHEGRILDTWEPGKADEDDDFPIAKELLVMTSQSANGMAGYNGSGSYFMQAFYKSWNDLRENQYQTATFKDLWIRVRATIRNGQSPQLGVYPKGFADELLFVSKDPNQDSDKDGLADGVDKCPGTRRLSRDDFIWDPSKYKPGDKFFETANVFAGCNHGQIPGGRSIYRFAGEFESVEKISEVSYTDEVINSLVPTVMTVYDSAKITDSEIQARLGTIASQSDGWYRTVIVDANESPNLVDTFRFRSNDRAKTYFIVYDAERKINQIYNGPTLNASNSQEIKLRFRDILPGRVVEGLNW